VFCVAPPINPPLELISPPVVMLESNKPKSPFISGLFLPSTTGFNDFPSFKV